jgi:hypothetical protein
MHSDIAGSDVIEFKDRKRRLIIAGILQSGAGLLSAISLPISFLGLFISPEVVDVLGGLPSVVALLIVNSFMAAWAITLGLGSIACKRWARALSLAHYWIYFLYGIPTSAIAVFYLPGLLQEMSRAANMPGGMVSLMANGTVIFMLVESVLFPLLMLLLYSGKHVKATCEHYHPQQSWTDKCPFPVLLSGMVLVFSIFGGINILAVSSFRSPFLGLMLSGAPAIMAEIAASLIYILIAYGLYKQKMMAWVGAIVMTITGGFSLVLSITQGEVEYACRLFGLSSYTMGPIDPALLPSRAVLIAGVLVLELVLFCYLIYIRRFFVSKPQSDVLVKETHEEAGCL